LLTSKTPNKPARPTPAGLGPEPHTRLRAVLALEQRILSSRRTESLHSCFASASVTLVRREPRRFASRSPQNSQKSQRRIAGSGPHSPSKVEERADSDAIVPCPPQEESHYRNLSGRNFTRPGNNPSYISIPGLPYSTRAFTHHRRRSCEPSKDSRKRRDESMTVKNGHYCNHENSSNRSKLEFGE